MSDDYKDILNAQKAQENPCVGLSQGAGYLSLRLEFRLKDGTRKSYAYATLSEVSFKEGELTFTFADSQILVKGLALSIVMDAANYHQVQWLAVGDNPLSVDEGQPFIEQIILKKSE